MNDTKAIAPDLATTLAELLTSHEDSKTEVRERAQAALDAVPMVEWSSMESMVEQPMSSSVRFKKLVQGASVGRWLLVVVAQGEGPEAVAWEIYLDGEQMPPCGFAATIAEARRAVVNELRSLGVAVREASA